MDDVNSNGNLTAEFAAIIAALEKLRADTEQLKLDTTNIRGDISQIVTAVRSLNETTNPRTPTIPVTWVEHGLANAWVVNPADGKPVLLGFRADGTVVWKNQE